MENINLDIGRGTKHVTERGQTLGTLNLDVVGRQWETNLPIRNFAFSQNHVFSLAVPEHRIG